MNDSCHQAQCLEDKDSAKLSNIRKISFGRVVAAVFTPCSEPGLIDTQAFRELCRDLVRRGCDGLFVAGSTGEMPLLDEDDRRELTVAAREAADDGAAVYVGVGGTGSSRHCDTPRMPKPTVPTLL